MPNKKQKRLMQEEKIRRATADKESAELAADQFEDQQMMQFGAGSRSTWRASGSSENAGQDAEKGSVERVETRRN